MFKPYVKFIWVLLIFVSGSALGQEQEHLFNTYIKSLGHYLPASQYTNERYISGLQLNDTLNIQVISPDDVEQIINSGIQDNVYGVQIQNTDKLDLAKVIHLLSGLPKLTFLEIDDWSVGKQNAYQLPSGIQKLQQLKSIEFRSTDKIDMEDALKKLGTLKQLQALMFTSYKHQLPANVADLKGVSLVTLSPDNVENIDLSKTNWQFADVNGLDGKFNKQINERGLLNLSRISSLRRLDLSMVILNDADVLTRFKQITTLRLYSSPVLPKARLFTKLGELKNLHSLLFRISQDTILFDGLQNLENLQELTISGLLTSFKSPEQLNVISSLKNLQSLSLDGLQLTFMPDIFNSLTRLEKVAIAGNNFTELPESIFNLPLLEYLNVSSNRLTALPQSQDYGCKNLKTLIVSFNAITVLPPAITGLKQLETFNASYNQIDLAPPGLFDLKKLKEIDLSCNKLITFPDGVQQMPGLEKLDVSYNDISFMPDITDDNYRLKSLSLNGNKLTSLPEHLGNYTELEFLNAGGNNLASLPQSLGDCKKLQYLNVVSYNWVLNYKPGWEMAGRIVKDSTKTNHIKALPAGLKDAKGLEALFLSGNPSIDSKSVFDVILSVPRKNFNVILSHDNISELPASPQWANMTFNRLDLSYNKLTTLPVEFATVKANYINLNHSFIQADKAIYDEPIENKTDMKILYAELGINLANINVPNGKYAAAITGRISDFYNAKKWVKAVEYADKAIAADSAVYVKKVQWEEIGIARFNLNDFTGAIKDLDHFIKEPALHYHHEQIFIDSIEFYKSAAQLALGQKEAAAKTHLYFSEKLNSTHGYQEAALIYLEIGKRTRYRQLIDTALSAYKQLLDKTHARQLITTPFIFDYIEVQLMAGKYTDAIELLKTEPSDYFSKPQLAMKSYLIATASYLNDPASFEQLKKILAAAIVPTGKTTFWGFTLFNQWLPYSGLSTIKQQQLLVLENIAK